MAGTRVVILAAGKGKRMGAALPKPLVPVLGKPMITHLIAHVVESGVDTKPIVVVAPDSYELFHSMLGDTCDYAVQHEQLGTGHAVLCAKDITGDASCIVVLYGDHPFIPAQTLRDLVSLHNSAPNALAMLTSTVPHYEKPYDAFLGWARIIRDTHGDVVAIREAKDCTSDERTLCEVNPGMYAFPADWLWEQLPQLGTTNASGEYYLTELITTAFEEGRMITTATADPLDVMGINTPEEHAAAEHVFAERKAH